MVPLIRTCAILALLAISACTTPAGSFCTVAQPIRPSATEIEALSDEQVKTVLVHNERGRKLCGWRAK